MMLAWRREDCRYGAFAALKDRAENNGYVPPRIKGVRLGHEFPFNYHVLDTKGDPMVHISRSL